MVLKRVYFDLPNLKLAKKEQKYIMSPLQKKKEKMIKMVAEKFDGKSEGISFENFKTFYNVLFGGADLERAMFFLDNKNNGVKIVENVILPQLIII